MALLQIGVSGLGFGAAVHLPVLLSMPEVKVIGVASSDGISAARIASVHSIPNACKGTGELLSLGLDAVTFALPPIENVSAVRQAAQNGLPFLCEKPLAHSYGEARALARLSESLVNAVDFEFAEAGVFRELKRIAETRLLGDPVRARIEWATQSWAVRNRMWSWKTDLHRGGGVVSLLGSHVLYLIEWLFGPTVTMEATLDSSEVSLFAPNESAPAPDSAHLQLRAGSVSIDVTLKNSSTNGWRHVWEVEFEQGSVKLVNTSRDYLSGFSISGPKVRSTPVPTGRSEEDGRISAFSRLCQRFVGGVRLGQEVRPNVRNGARVQFLMDAVTASASKGSAVDVSMREVDS